MRNSTWISINFVILFLNLLFMADFIASRKFVPVHVFSKIQYVIPRTPLCGIRKGLDVNFILIKQSSGSYLHYSKIDYIKFYSAQLNSQFQYNSKFC